MTEKTLKFNNIRVNKKEFDKSKKLIDLLSVNVDQIVISDKFKDYNEGFKYFISYQEGEIVKPLCIILSQMSGYIKYFEYGGKNMYFLIKDDDVQEKYKQIWDVIKNNLKIKFHSLPVYDKKYIKTKVREYDGAIKTSFLGNDVLKENMHYTCIACITIDSVMRMEKKYFPQVYLEECKYKENTNVKIYQHWTNLDSDSDSESDAELMAKLKSDSDNSSEKMILINNYK